MDNEMILFGNQLDLDYFWRINKKTDAKINWLKERGYL